MKAMAVKCATTRHALDVAAPLDRLGKGISEDFEAAE